MNTTLTLNALMAEQDKRIAETVSRERGQLANFIRRRVPDAGEADEGSWLDEILPSPDAGPEAAYARAVLLEELYAALAELPEEQRVVFIAHELDGRSFKELAAESGVGVNTLLARKRYAVMHLRGTLKDIYDEFNL